MIIESLRLFYHLRCFQCCVCQVQLGNGASGTDVRVRNNKLHCQNCYSNDEGMYTYSYKVFYYSSNELEVCLSVCNCQAIINMILCFRSKIQQGVNRKRNVETKKEKEILILNLHCEKMNRMDSTI